MRYTKRPITIDAMQWHGSDSDAHHVVLWILNNGGKAHYQSTPIKVAGPGRGITTVPPHIVIETLEGKMKAFPGDYVIKGIKGEFYSCKADIFSQTYEVAEDDDGEEAPEEAQ